MRIERSARTDVPEPFKAALAARIRRRRGLTDFERSLRAFNALRRPERDMFIRSLYREITGLLKTNGPVIHPILGELQVPSEISRTRSQTALHMTHSILLSLGMDPPSEARMFNIV